MAKAAKKAVSKRTVKTKLTQVKGKVAKKVVKAKSTAMRAGQKLEAKAKKVVRKLKKKVGM